MFQVRWLMSKVTALAVTCVLFTTLKLKTTALSASQRGGVLVPVPAHLTEPQFRVRPRAACHLPGGSTMTLLLQNLFKELPPDSSVDTKTFLDNVSNLPSFFGGYLNATHQLIRLGRPVLSPLFQPASEDSFKTLFFERFVLHEWGCWVTGRI